MARFVIRHRIQTPEALREFDEDGYAYASACRRQTGWCSEGRRCERRPEAHPARHRDLAVCRHLGLVHDQRGDGRPAARCRAAAAAVGWLTASVQIGFIAGTFGFALLSIADRFSPRKVFLVCSLLAGAFGCAVTALLPPELKLLLALRFSPAWRWPASTRWA